MKKKYLLIIGVLLLVLSCRKAPEAEIGADKTVANVNEVISFTNSSENSKTFLWDFGDGTSSNKDEPKKVYLSPGYYAVEMTAYSRKERDDSQSSLAILIRGMEGEYEGNYSGFTTGSGELVVERKSGEKDITIIPDGLPSFTAEVTGNGFVIPQQSGTEDGTEYTISGAGLVESTTISFDYILIFSGNTLEGSFEGTLK